MRKRSLVTLAALALAASLTGSAAAASPPPRIVQPAHHGGTGGHLPPSRANVDLMARLRLSNVVPGWVTDVATYRNTAYLGAWGVRCGQGIPGGFWSVDIRNPRRPRQLRFVSAPPGTYQTEGMHALRLTTRSFRGDVLVVSNEPCQQGFLQGMGGISLYDVTNPARPRELALGAGDRGGTPGRAHSSHSAFAWDAGNRAYAALVDNEDGSDGDIDFMDITNPRSPRWIGETGLNDWRPAQDNLALGEQALVHDVIVRRVRGRWLMLASYWDAGYVVLDVTNPAAPRYLRDSDFPATDTLTGLPWSEGNAHEAEWDRCPEEGVRSAFPCRNVRYVLAADEDLDPEPIFATITSGPYQGEGFGGLIAGGSPPINRTRFLDGPTRFLGQACAPVPQAPSPNAIGVAERGGCSHQTKLDSIQAAGYGGAVVMSDADAQAGCERLIPADVVGARIHLIQVTRATGMAILGITGYDPARCPSGQNPGTPAVGASGASIRIAPVFDGWGYLRLLDANTMRQIDAFAIPEAIDPHYATGYGDLTVHEITTDPTGDVGYVAWYSAGFRVVDFSGGDLREVGHYIAPEGSDIWGVELNVRRDGRLFALASDRNYGLYIFRFGTDLLVGAPRRTSATVGRTLTLTSRVRNDGTIGESAARYAARLPVGLVAVSASSSQGGCATARARVTCNLGALAEGATARVTLTIRPTRAGTHVFAGSVNGRQAEYDVGNNGRRTSVAVRGR
jgi:uncharacterized repeat protein (TIGR01451 family)